MILFNSGNILKYMDYGILIPYKESSSVKAFHMLKNHPVIGPILKNSHVEKIPSLINKSDISRVHSKDYTEKLFSDKVENEILKTYELVDKHGTYHRYDPSLAVKPLRMIFQDVLNIVSGSYTSMELALHHGFCFYFGGGMHHAMRDHGSGFCMVNDIVVALRKLQHEGKIKTAWVIDVDAHKGDGTAALTEGDSSIVTFSIHMAKGWPLDSPEYDQEGNFNISYTPSDIDIPIDPENEASYNPSLMSGLNDLEKFPIPDMAVVVDGADPFEEDELDSTAQLKLNLAQLLERDTMVYTFLKNRNIPSAFLNAGGYGDNSWKVYYQFLEWYFMKSVNYELG